MSQNFSHKIKAESVTAGFNPKAEEVQVHKAGCGHEAKLDYVDPFNPENVGADDYFPVAPCARKA